MKKNGAKKDFKVNTLVIIELIALFAFFSYYYLNIGLNNKETVTVNYTKNNKVLDYKVYIKEEYQDLYGKEFLESNSTYISDVIDYIDVDFDYNLIFDKSISGTYFYTIKATTSADVNKNRNWEEENIIFTSDPYVIKDNKNVNIKENVKLNYNEYQEKMRDFKYSAATGLDVTSKVDLKLDITVKDIVNDDIDGTKNINAYASVSIPLVDKNTDISITSDAPDTTGTYEKIVVLDDTKYEVFKYIGIVFGTLAVCLFFVIILNYIGLINLMGTYTRELNKILKTYDSIIVTAKQMPELSGMKVVTVSTMQELLDAHSEVRMPINFIEETEGKKAHFILIDGKMAWVYTLKDEKAKRK